MLTPSDGVSGGYGVPASRHDGRQAGCAAIRAASRLRSHFAQPFLSPRQSL
ncbi:hypothetical protein LTSEWAN_5802 [Salmonella enterica subsp. enterica serovar Wandsworth str. A4-580]|uniref:Uncharacterized protein n=1 Tax=Salmonella enterica subsp. enterica serovar Wandsworth str. A4-580 TaxID=913086 RepID=G5SJ89_SALET|nr:hypothetical protein LTSEWAN_5802 [Salmonella enterica subsp. enterica serovar Wandsworth str. A4-580]